MPRMLLYYPACRCCFKLPSRKKKKCANSDIYPSPAFCGDVRKLIFSFLAMQCIGGHVGFPDSERMNKNPYASLQASALVGNDCSARHSPRELGNQVTVLFSLAFFCGKPWWWSSYNWLYSMVRGEKTSALRKGKISKCVGVAP